MQLTPDGRRRDSQGDAEDKPSAKAPAKKSRLSRRVRTKRLTVCAMLSALGVVLVWFGAIFEVLDLSLAAMASLLLVPIVIEYGGWYAWAIYFATTALSLLLLPQKMPALSYLLFGYYPILKKGLDRLPRWGRWLCKELFYLALEIAIVWLSDRLIGVENTALWYRVLLYVVGFGAMNLFDFALSRLIALYFHRYRALFRKWMN